MNDIEKAFGKWIAKVAHKREYDSIKYLWETNRKDEMLILYTAGAKYILENLPKCETCEYFKDRFGIWGGCRNKDVNITMGLVPKDFGCIFHSELEKLRRES